MALITVTEKNFMQIAGRVKKFLNDRDVVTWHSLDRGKKEKNSEGFCFSILQ